MSALSSLSSFSSSNSSRHKPKSKSASGFIVSSGRGGSGNIRPSLSAASLLLPSSPSESLNSLTLNPDIPSSLSSLSASSLSTYSSRSSTPDFSRSPSPSSSYATSLAPSHATSRSTVSHRSVKSLTAISYVCTYNDEPLSITTGREPVVVTKSTQNAENNRMRDDEAKFGKDATKPKVKRMRSGRGGAGTTKSFLYDAKTFPRTTEALAAQKSLEKQKERTLIELSIDAAKAFGSTGRGGSGNIGHTTPNLKALHKSKSSSNKLKWSFPQRPRLLRSTSDEAKPDIKIVVEPPDLYDDVRVEVRLVDESPIESGPKNEVKKNVRQDTIGSSESSASPSSSSSSSGPYTPDTPQDSFYGPIPMPFKTRYFPSASLPSPPPLSPLPLPPSPSLRECNIPESSKIIPVGTQIRPRPISRPKPTIATKLKRRSKDGSLSKNIRDTSTKHGRRRSLTPRANMMTIVHENDAQFTDIKTELHYFSDEDDWEGDDVLSDDGSFGDEDGSGVEEQMTKTTEMADKPVDVQHMNVIPDGSRSRLDLNELRAALDEEENVFSHGL